MADNQHSDIFSDTECLSMDIMEKYANDALPNAEQQAVEKHLLDCAICSDALEGLTLAGFSEDIGDRVSSLNERIASETQQSTTSFWKKQYTSYAAAVIGIMIMSVLVVNYLKKDLVETDYISQDLAPESKVEETTIPPAPSKDDFGVASGEKVDALKDGQDYMDSTETETAAALAGALDSDQGGEGVALKKQAMHDVSGKILANEQDKLAETEEEISIDGDAEEPAYFSSTGSTSTPEEKEKSVLDKEVDNKRLGWNDDSRYRNQDEDRDNRNSAGLYETEVTGGDVDDLTTRSDVGDGFYNSQQETVMEERTETSRELNEPIVAQTKVVEAESRGKESAKKAKEESFKLESKSEVTMSAQDEIVVSNNIEEDLMQRPEEYDDANTLQNITLPMTSSTSSSSAKSKDEAKKSANVPSGTSGKKNDETFQSAYEYNDVLTVGNEAQAAPATADPEPTTETIALIALDSTSAEMDPMFKGGEASLRQYLLDNMVYPDAAKALGLDCKVKVSFTVNADSTISNAKVIEPIGGGCDEEAIRVINKMPNWVPARNKGKKVSRQYNMELDFESIK